MDTSKLQRFAELVKKESGDETRIIPGRVYTKVDAEYGGGWLGKYMVENQTGMIYFIKGYGVPNKLPQHTHGTLDTIEEWDWSGWEAKRKAG